MVRKKSKKTVLPLLVIISAIIFTGLIGAITFQNIFPTSTPYITNESTVNLSYGIHAGDGLSSITHSWNGTNTTLYDSSLVLFMNFDNRSELGENDTIVKDLSMYGNNGTVVGGENITWTANGKYGGAFNFSGKKNYIDCGTMSSINFSKNWTASFFYKRFTTNSGNLIDYNTDSSNKMWDLSLSSNFIKFEPYNSTGTQVSYSSSTSTILSNLNEWHQIVFNYVEGGGFYIYLDGNSFYNNTNINTALKVGSPNFYIGTVRKTGAFFNGSMDDLLIFNRSLSQAEISTLYQSQYTKYNTSFWMINRTQITSIYSQPYFQCSANSTNYQTCSTTNTIRQVNTINANFSIPIGNINNYFYGINLGFPVILPTTMIALNGDNKYNSYTDSEWHISSINNANIKTIRVSTELDELTYYNGSSGLPVFNGTVNGYININTFKDEVIVAKNNNWKLIFIIAPTPNWLANKTSGYCNLTTQQNYTCSPSNYSMWEDIVYNFLNEVDCDSDTCGVEVWNEPYLQTSWLNNLTTSNPIRSVELNKLINATYKGVMKFNSSMKVYAPSTHIYGVANTILWENFMGNFSDSSLYPNLYFSYHYISTDYDTADVLSTIYSVCTSSGFDCSEIYDGEWKHKDATEQNTTSLWNKWEENVAYSYLTNLNNYPSNISTAYYGWTSRELYNINDTEYPYVAKFVSEPLLDNTFYPPYNVTKNFAHLCPAGATVYVSSGDDDSIKQVSCKKGNMYSLIVINTDTNAKNITVNMTNNTNSKMFPYTSIMNYETGASIPVSTSGIAQLGVLDSYEILYLTSGAEGGAVLTNQFKFNEATGTRVYDLLQNVTYGTISGATWINDSILITLSAVQYTIDLVTGLLTLDTDYLYEYLFVDYGYNKVFGFHVSILGVIAGFLMIIVLGVGIIYVVKYFKNIKELE